MLSRPFFLMNDMGLRLTEEDEVYGIVDMDEKKSRRGGDWR